MSKRTPRQQDLLEFVLRVALASGLLSEEQVREALEAIDRLGRRVYGLVR